MAGTINTPVDLIHLCLKTAGVVGVGQEPDFEDTNDCFVILNTILQEWQVKRWLVYPLVDIAFPSTGATTYTVGPAGDFDTGAATVRPDKIDALYSRLISTSIDTPLYQFMSREGYARVAHKALVGAPESYFYDPTIGTLGVLHLYPVPSALYNLHLNCKASLGQFSSLTQPITLPPPYLNALQWNLAADIRPLYQLPDDPSVTMRAERSLQALVNSIAQVPTAVEPTPSNRQGIYSFMVPGGQPSNQGQQ